MGRVPDVNFQDHIRDRQRNHRDKNDEQDVFISHGPCAPAVVRWCSEGASYRGRGDAETPDLVGWMNGIVPSGLRT